MLLYNNTYEFQMVRGRSAVQMAEEFISVAAHKTQANALWGARALRRLLPERTAQALQLATAVHYPDLSIQVPMHHVVHSCHSRHLSSSQAST